MNDLTQGVVSQPGGDNALSNLVRACGKVLHDTLHTLDTLGLKPWMLFSLVLVGIVGVVVVAVARARGRRRRDPDS